MHSANWDDLKYVLAVAEEGSVSAAAKALGVNHATVLRRINAWEDAFGTQVFERSAQGYRLRPDKVSVIEAARAADVAMQSVARLMGDGTQGLGQTIRLTSVDSLCVTVLAPAMPGLAAKLAPDRLTLLASNDRLDLARLQADLCLRPADKLPEDMQGEIVGYLGFGLYQAPEAPKVWLGMTGALGRSRPAKWLSENVPRARILAAADSFVTLRGMALAGTGRAILPCILGDTCPGLERVPDDFPDLTVPLWLASHRDLATTPRITRAQRAVADVMRRNSGLLTGAA